jgi:hypothetical protein
MTSLFWVWVFLTAFCTDITYLHMDLNTRVLKSESYRYYLRLNVLFSRSIGPDNSFPGTAGSYTSSKSHLRISADILACHHIGIGLLVIHGFLSRVYDSNDGIDAPNYYESSFWKESDPVSGLGGWGDPNADFTVPDGGFSNFQISYPSPHTVRRNFTLFPYNVSFPLFTDLLKPGNASFLASAVEAVLDTSVGDFKGFQVALEAPEVRNSHVIYVFLMLNSTNRRAHTLALTRPRAGELLQFPICLGNPHLSRHLATSPEGVQQPH